MRLFDATIFTRLKENTILTHTGVTCGFADQVFEPEVYKELVSSFPDPRYFQLVDKANSGGGRKRFYVGPEYVHLRHAGSLFHLKNLPNIWKQLLDEMASPDTMKLLQTATSSQLNTLCNFGLTYGNGGCLQEPHLDGAIRNGVVPETSDNIALLIYFNEKADPVSATEIYDLDRKTILLKGDTMRNSLSFFKQHPNAWHGFPLVPPHHTRKILSLAYGNFKEPIPVDWSFGSYVKVKSKKFISKIKKATGR